MRDTLERSEILEQLTRDPSLVEDWVSWSEDKRTSEGWYFLLRDYGGTVGYLGSSEPDLVFTSSAEACAEFILREVAGIDSRNATRVRRKSHDA